MLISVRDKVMVTRCSDIETSFLAEGRSGIETSTDADIAEGQITCDTCTRGRYRVPRELVVRRVPVKVADL